MPDENAMAEHEPPPDKTDSLREMDTDGGPAATPARPQAGRSRWRRWLMGVAVVGLAVLAVGVAILVWLNRQIAAPPAFYAEATVPERGTEERRQRIEEVETLTRRLFEPVASKAAGGQPSPNATAPAVQPTAASSVPVDTIERAAIDDDDPDIASPIASPIATPESPAIAFSAEQLNVLLAEAVASGSVPPQFSAPRVRIERGRMLIGSEVDLPPARTVLWARIRPQLVDARSVRLNIEAIRSGQLALPIERLLADLQSGSVVTLDTSQPEPALVVDWSAEPEVALDLASVELVDDAIVFRRAKPADGLNE